MPAGGSSCIAHALPCESLAAKGVNVSVIGPTEFGGNVLKPRFLLGSLSSVNRLRRHAHQRKKPLDFLRFDLDASLPAPTALVIADVDGLTSDLKLARVGITQPWG